MSIESELEAYLLKVKELREIENAITESLPDQLWTRYTNLQKEIPSDKSVLQKKLREGKQTIEHDNIKFVVYNRNTTKLSEDFLPTARDLGHLEKLVDLGVITGIKINEDQIERLDPELQAIYGNLVDKVKTLAVRWPKKADK